MQQCPSTSTVRGLLRALELRLELLVALPSGEALAALMPKIRRRHVITCSAAAHTGGDVQAPHEPTWQESTATCCQIWPKTRLRFLSSQASSASKAFR